MAIRWERRRLAVLQAMLGSDRDAGPLDTGRVIETLVDKVRSFGGRVEELGASGFVALFGLEPVEDAVRRAALAAVAMQRAARETPGGSPGPGVRIGIDLGSFLLGRLPDASLVDTEDKRTALGAMGALVEGTEPGSVVVSGAAAPFLARGFDLMPLGAVAGRRSAFRLGGLERGGEAARGRRTRFVGRDHELDLLRSRLDTAVRGQGQVVAIAGEAGIGKSRLIVELRRGLSDQPILCLEGHCLPYATPIPCLPLVEFLRAACAIVETDGPDGVRDKLRGTLDRAGMDGVAATPYLLHLLDPGEGGEALARLSPEVVKARTFETLRELSRRLAGRAPLVLVVEDLHWVDRTSEEYLTTLVEVVAGARILLVTTHRPGYRPPWMDKSYGTQVALQPLSPWESLSLVRDVIGPAEVDEPTVEMIVAKAEGNPFFAEELARAVTEGGSPTPGSPAPAVPDTVEEVLMARIDRLAAEDKRVLQAAAVVGRRLPFLLLQAILDPPDEALREHLARLQGAEFLFETRAASELEYTFKHTLTHEVAYASLLPGQRRALHARIVDVLESWQPEGREELVERLAHHAIGAEVWDKAVDYARRAGRQAMARSAHRDAAAWFDQAIAALARLPERRELLEQAVDLRFDVRNALQPLADFRTIMRYLREAEVCARTLGDQRRLGQALAYQTDYFRLTGDRARALEAGQQAMAIAEALDDLPLRVAAGTWLGLIFLAQGDYATAIGLFRRNVDTLVGDRLRDRLGLPQPPAVYSRALLAWCLAELGRFDEGITWANEAVRIARSVDQPLGLIVAHVGLGRVHLRRGDAEEAIAVLEPALSLVQKWGTPLWFPSVASDLGLAYALAGRVAEGLPLLHQAVDRAVSMDLVRFRSRLVGAVGEAYLLAGRLDEAEEVARRALALARAHGERADEARTLRLLGDVRARAGSVEAASPRDRYEEALAIAEDLGMRPLVALCRLRLARLERLTGDGQDADAQLEVATGMLRALGMSRFLDEAEGARGGSATGAPG